MKQIIVRDSDKTPYVLTFTAETVKALEGLGFDPDLVTVKPMTMIPMLFYGALAAENAGKITEEKALKLYQEQADKAKLIKKLLELYNEPIDEVIAKEGNATWECNF